MQEQPQQSNLWQSLLTREMAQMVAIFSVILVITALLANQTANYTARLDTAGSVAGDIEDVSDAVFEPLQLMQETGEALVTESFDVSQPESVLDTVEAQLPDDLLPSLSAITIMADDTSLTLTVSETGITVDENASADLDSESAWQVTESLVRHVVTDNGTTIALDIQQETLAAIMEDAARGEDLFEITDNGYIVLVSDSNEVITAFNRSDIPAEDVADLRGALTDDIFDEDDEYYDLEADPLLDEQSFVATMSGDIADWVVIGAYPESEIPEQGILSTTNRLFEVTEVGDTFSQVVERSVNFLNEDIGWLFRGLRYPIEIVIDAFEGLLLATHWSIILLVTGIIAGLVAGRRVVYISVISMFLIGLLGLWDLTMTTLAMLLTSMAFCVVVGIPLGIWSARSDTVNDIVRSVLDAMQTIHPFVYLVPIVVLFGIGKVPGTIATIIFALPPMVRLTNLGIRQVPEDVVEAGRAFGSSDWQLLRNVQIPLALPSIMAGINQTLMLSLSMVVIVALIAGGGLGQEIFRAIGRADTGRAVVAGVAVLLLAVTVDRISQGEPTKKKDE